MKRKNIIARLDFRKDITQMQRLSLNKIYLCIQTTENSFNIYKKYKDQQGDYFKVEYKGNTIDIEEGTIGVFVKILEIGQVQIFNRETDFEYQNKDNKEVEELPKDIVRLIENKEVHTATNVLVKSETMAESWIIIDKYKFK